VKRSTPIEGRCLCGAVRFAGRPPALFSCHCHCHWCRRAHGAAFVTWIGVAETAFTIVAGSSSVRWYRSSEISERGFCAECGTTMFFRSKAAPGEVHIALACVDDTTGLDPTLHIFHDAHVAWVTLGDDLPRRDRDAPGVAGYRAVAERPET
jgi:hypothetical protein